MVRSGFAAFSFHLVRRVFKQSLQARALDPRFKDDYSLQPTAPSS